MKKLLLLTLFIFLTGCSYFQGSDEVASESTQTPVDQSALASLESVDASKAEESEQEVASDHPANSEFDNVFGEEVIGADRYPASTLPDEIPIAELRHAMEVYYASTLPTDQKVANYEKIEGDLINDLQNSLKESEQFAELAATVDQVQIDFDGKTNYVLRIVVGHSYDDAQKIYKDNDIQLINEALTHIGNRFVMLAYYDEAEDTLTPYHLNNSTHSLFSLVE